jgi:superkiller protein 3
MTPPRRLRGGRLIALALAGVLAAAAAAPAAGQRPRPAPLPEPVMDGVEPEVRRQLESRRAEAESLAAEPDADAGELAQRYGTLGGLYLVYGFTVAAEPALGNARALSPDDFRWHYLLASLLQATGRQEAAIEAYRRALELEPSYPAALIRFGEALLDLARPAEAAEVFERAIAGRPSAAGHFGRGRAAAATGDWQGAVEHYERALELQPSASAVRYPLGLAYRELGRLDRARGLLAGHGPVEPTFPDPVMAGLRGLATGSSIHFARGRNALGEADLETAVAEFERALEIDPGNAAVRRALGLALLRAGDPARAAEQYREATRADPASALNHKDLSRALLEAGRWEEAAAAAQRAVELAPELADAHLALGLARIRGGRAAEALPALARAVELAPFDAGARYEHAMASIAAGRTAQGAELLEALLEQNPGHTAGRISFGLVREMAGDAGGARQALETALAAGAEDTLAARAHLGLGRLAERGGELGTARDHYARALELDPGLLPARLRLASALGRGGDPSAAADTFAVALEDSPGQLPTGLARAAALILAGRHAEARDTLESLVAAAPGDVAVRGVLALLLATAPEDAVRDGERAHELARETFAAAPGPILGQILAMALAERGRFEEAVRAQTRIVAALEPAGATEPLAGARERLDLYRRGTPARAPWRREPGLLPPPWLPLPAVASPPPAPP